MKKLLFCLCLFGNLSAFAQHKVTFEVEELSKPEKLLPVRSCEDIYKRLILSEAGSHGKQFFGFRKFLDFESNFMLGKRGKVPEQTQAEQ